MTNVGIPRSSIHVTRDFKIVVRSVCAETEFAGLLVVCAGTGFRAFTIYEGRVYAGTGFGFFHVTT